jgi:TonB family protein
MVRPAGSTPALIFPAPALRSASSGSVVVSAQSSSWFWLAIVTSLLILASIPSARGQNVIAGPYGVPRMVMDDTGTWQEPIPIFENAKMKVFIPDITGASWAAWHVQRRGEHDFSYFLDVYTYYPEKRATVSELINVDTRDPNHLVVTTLLARKSVDLGKNPELKEITARITALVVPEAMRQPSEVAAIEDGLVQQKEAMAQMAACANGDADCSLSPSEFEKKHPVYARHPLQVIMGGVPEANCSPGTDRPCCCASGNNSPTATTSDSGTSLPDADGLYRIGARVSAPVALVTPLAQYTDDARRARYAGVCVISVIVDTQGNARDPQVIRGVEYGMNERAVRAVLSYKFRPALLDGKTPVPVRITIEINLRFVN